MIKSCYQNVVKFTHFISKEEETNKCHVKHVFWKRFKNSVKQLASLFLADAFYSESTQREKSHSNSSPKAPSHWGTQGIWVLEHLGYSGTRRAVKELGHSGTWAFRHSKGAWTLRHSGTWTLGHSRHSRHFI